MKKVIKSNQIENAINIFHEKFYPEAIVEFVGSSEEAKLAFIFTGHMCLTCGVEDYFEDFRVILNEALGEEYVKVKQVPLDEEHTAWLIIYAPREIAKSFNYKVKYLVIDPNKNREEVVTPEV